MILTVGPIYYRDKTLLAELASRSGSTPDDGSHLSPYKGEFEFVCQQAPADIGPRFIIDKLNDDSLIPDYNASKSGAKTDIPHYVGARHEEGFEMFLERTDSSWIHAYLLQQIISIKINNRGGIVEARRATQEDRPFYDEEGNLTYMSELLNEEDNTSGNDISGARAMLRYCLKFLHRQSQEYGVSFISLLISLEHYRNQLKPNVDQMLSNHPVWAVDKQTGDLSHTLSTSANHNAQFPRALAAVQTPGTPIFDVAQKLRQTCDVLGVSLADEDPSIYTSEFINNLVVSTITSNRDYGSQRNPNVLSALTTASISDVTKDMELIQVQNSALNKTIWTFSNAPLSRIGNREDPSMIAEFLATYNQVIKDPAFKVSSATIEKITHGRTQLAPNLMFPARLEWLREYRGFYCLPYSKTPYQFQVGGIAELSYGADKAILHVSGLLVLVRNSSPLYYLPVQDATDYLRNTTTPMGQQLYGSDLKMGRWQH